MSPAKEKEECKLQLWARKMGFKRSGRIEEDAMFERLYNGHRTYFDKLMHYVHPEEECIETRKAYLNHVLQINFNKDFCKKNPIKVNLRSKEDLERYYEYLNLEKSSNKLEDKISENFNNALRKQEYLEIKVKEKEILKHGIQKQYSLNRELDIGITVVKNVIQSLENYCQNTEALSKQEDINSEIAYLMNDFIGIPSFFEVEEFNSFFEGSSGTCNSSLNCLEPLLLKLKEVLNSLSNIDSNALRLDGIMYDILDSLREKPEMVNSLQEIKNEVVIKNMLSQNDLEITVVNTSKFWNKLVEISGISLQKSLDGLKTQFSSFRRGNKISHLLNGYFSYLKAKDKGMFQTNNNHIKKQLQECLSEIGFNMYQKNLPSAISEFAEELFSSSSCDDSITETSFTFSDSSLVQSFKYDNSSKNINIDQIFKNIDEIRDYIDVGIPKIIGLLNKLDFYKINNTSLKELIKKLKIVMKNCD